MATRSTRQEARARILSVFNAQLDRVIPEDENDLPPQMIPLAMLVEHILDRSFSRNDTHAGSGSNPDTSPPRHQGTKKTDSRSRKKAIPWVVVRDKLPTSRSPLRLIRQSPHPPTNI